MQRRKELKSKKKKRRTIGHDYIDPSKLVNCLLDKSFNVGDLGHVCLHCQGAVWADFGDELVGELAGGVGDVVDYDRGPVGGDSLGDGAADALCGAGDDEDFV